MEKQLIMYKGRFAGFPVEVVEKMLERQFEQHGRTDLEVSPHGAFIWRDTIEGFDFWHRVIDNKDYDLFFQRHPKSYGKWPIDPRADSFIKNLSIQKP